MNGDWVVTGRAAVFRVSTSTCSRVCPDLLELDDLGVADNLRGRVVRGIFWLLSKIWPVR